MKVNGSIGASGYSSSSAWCAKRNVARLRRAVPEVEPHRPGVVGEATPATSCRRRSGRRRQFAVAELAQRLEVAAKRVVEDAVSWRRGTPSRPAVSRVSGFSIEPADVVDRVLGDHLDRTRRDVHPHQPCRCSSRRTSAGTAVAVLREAQRPGRFASSGGTSGAAAIGAVVVAHQDHRAAVGTSSRPPRTFRSVSTSQPRKPGFSATSSALRSEIEPVQVVQLRVVLVQADEHVVRKSLRWATSRHCTPSTGVRSRSTPVSRSTS